jgi:hypothetical protein
VELDWDSPLDTSTQAREEVNLSVDAFENGSIFETKVLAQIRAAKCSHFERSFLSPFLVLRADG